MSAGPLTVTHLVVTDNFAGVERYVTTVAAATADLGWRVRVLGGRRDEMLAALPDGVHWTPAPTLGAAVRALARLDDDPGDVWHLHMTAAETAAALLPHRRRRLATRHFAATRGSSPAARLAGRFAAARLDAEIAISETVRDAAGVPSLPVLLNPVPVNVTPRAPSRAVVVAQRLEAEKRTAEAVRVFAASGLAGAGWTLEIHGRGSERAELDRLIHELDLGSAARLAGFTTDMTGLYARAGVFLATADLEPLGLAVAEAMAAGVPVVATDAGGHRETVGGVDGAALYPVGAVDLGAAALREVATSAEREHYGERLRDHARDRFGVERHVVELTEIYRNAARRDHRPEEQR